MFWRAKKWTGPSSQKKKTQTQLLLIQGNPTNLLQVFQNLLVYTLLCKEFLHTFNDIFNNGLVQFRLHQKKNRHFQVKMSIKSFEKVARSLISLHKLLLQTEQHEQISLTNGMSNAKVCKSTHSFKSNIPKKVLDFSLKLLFRLPIIQ